MVFSRRKALGKGHILPLRCLARTDRQSSLESRERKYRSLQERTLQSTGSTLRPQLEETGDSSPTEDSVAADETERKRTSGEPDHLRQAASELVAQDQRGKGRLGSRLRDSVKRKLHCLGAIVRFEMQSGKNTSRSLGHRTEYDRPSDPSPKGPEYARGGERTNPVEPHQHAISEPGSHQEQSNGVILIDDAGLEPLGSDNGKPKSPGPTAVQPPSEQTQRAQGPNRDLVSAPDRQSPIQTWPDSPEPGPAVGLRTLESANSKEPILTESSSSETTVQPEEDNFKNAFGMVIHLPGDESARRVCCLDTGADLDVISHEVVESLRLKKERYKGTALKPLGGHFQPEWEVTFDWHVARFHRTYTTTFVVLDEKHSGDFDVIIGRTTIQQNRFYIVNGKVWMVSANDDEVCLVQHG